MTYHYLLKLLDEIQDQAEKDGLCPVFVNGCTDETSCDYDPMATCNDGSCTPSGCTDPLACNYDPGAVCDNGTCVFESYGCTDPQQIFFIICMSKLSIKKNIVSENPKSIHVDLIHGI